MAKVRVYELARELKWEAKLLLAKLAELGISVKSVSSTLPEDEAAQVLKHIKDEEAARSSDRKARPTVIRRRKEKPPEVEPTPPPPEAGAVPVSAETPAPVAAEPHVKEVKETETPPPPSAEPVAPSVAKTPEGVVPTTPVVSRPPQTPVAEAVPPSAPEKVLTAEEKKAAAAEEERKKAKKKLKKKETSEEELPPVKKAAAKKREEPKWQEAPARVVERVVKIEHRKKKKDFPREREVAKKTEITTPKAIKRIIRIEEAISVGDLAHRMGVKAGEVIAKLMGLGIMATINQSIDLDAASLVAHEFGYEVEQSGLDLDNLLKDQEDAPESLAWRPPVVTIMGHVDHGKTALLDAIRKSNIIDTEFGGITQHIGAYSVPLEGKSVVFLDTPGHEAFTALRARGAKITDIVILVVAADDGVMAQTVEAINHARAANVPIIVAINKIDKPEANLDYVRRSLMEHGLISENLGGDTIMAEVSAKMKLGIKELLELILLQAEVMELKANPNRAARGTVIEARLDKGRGPVATILVQKGTLKVGDFFVAGGQSGRVRAMSNDQGQKITSAPPSTPVEVQGFANVPQAGEDFVVLADERAAKKIASLRGDKLRVANLSQGHKVSLEDLFARIKAGEAKELNLLVKADVQGSVDAVKESISKLPSESIRVNIIHSGIGGVNETDVMLAAASQAVIIAFNVRSEVKAAQLAADEGVDLRYYNIIYEAINDIQAAMVGLLEPTYKEKTLGRAEVRTPFVIPKIGTVAGSMIVSGKFTRGVLVRLIRDEVVVHEGRVASLRRFKDDVKEVQSGFECGIKLENYNDLKVGDVLEAYELEEVAPQLM